MKMLFRAGCRLPQVTGVALVALLAATPATAQEAQTLPKALSLPLTGNELMSVGVPGSNCSASATATGSCGYSFQAVTTGQVAALASTGSSLNISTLTNAGALAGSEVVALGQGGANRGASLNTVGAQILGTLPSRVATAEGNISSNGTAISGLQTSKLNADASGLSVAAAYTLSTGLGALPALAVPAGTETSNLLQANGTAVKTSLAQIGVYARQGVATLRQVGKRTQIPNTLNTAATQGMHRRAEIAGENLTSLQLVYANFYATPTAEAAPGATRTITASVEYPSGTYTQALASGSAQGVAADGQAQLVFTATGLNIPRGATYWVRTYQSSTAGILTGYSTTVSNDLGDYGTIGTSVADSTMASFTGTLGNGNYGPSAIVANSRVAALAEAGDSEFEGVGNAQGLTVFSGILGPSVGPYYGLLNLSRGSMTAQAAATNFTKRATYFQYATHAVTDLGTNDIVANSTSAANVLAYRQQFIALAPTLPWIMTTLLPREASSTDGYTSILGQTSIASQSTFVAVNRAIRAGEPGSIGMWDVALGVESGLESGRWATGDQRTVTDAGITSGANVLSSNTAFFSDSDVGLGVTIAGAGASGANLVTSLSYRSGGSSTAEVVAASAGTTVSNATALIGSLTTDGTHPNHRAMQRFRPYIDLGLITRPRAGYLEQ
jgi:hypothetical protein